MSTEPKQDERARFRPFEWIPVSIVVRVGRTRLTLADLGQLAEGDVLRLDRPVGDPFELVVGGEALAEVEPVAADDGIALKLVRCTKEADDDATG